MQVDDNCTSIKGQFKAECSQGREGKENIKLKIFKIIKQNGLFYILVIDHF